MAGGFERAIRLRNSQDWQSTSLNNQGNSPPSFATHEALRVRNGDESKSDEDRAI